MTRPRCAVCERRAIWEYVMYDHNACGLWRRVRLVTPACGQHLDLIADALTAKHVHCMGMASGIEPDR